MKPAMCLRFFLLSLISVASLYAGDFTGTAPTHAETRLLLFGQGGPVVQTQNPGDMLSPPDAREGRKSAGLALTYSLLLPGMGELYAGNFGSGKYFLIAEGVIWLTYASFQVYGNALQDDARSFAVTHAGISSAGKDDQFYVNVGNFTSVDEYNDKKLRDRTPNLVYAPGRGYGWRWDSEASRLTFRDQRIAADNVFNDQKFIVAAVVVNHVASAINAVRSVISHNKELTNVLGDVQFHADVIGGLAHPQGVMLTVCRSF